MIYPLYLAVKKYVSASLVIWEKVKVDHLWHNRFQINSFHTLLYFKFWGNSLAERDETAQQSPKKQERNIKFTYFGDRPLTVFSWIWTIFRFQNMKTYLQLASKPRVQSHPNCDLPFISGGEKTKIYKIYVFIEKMKSIS